MTDAGPMSQTPGFGPPRELPPEDERVSALRKSSLTKLSSRYDIPLRARRSRKKTLILRIDPGVFQRLVNAVAYLRDRSVSLFCEKVISEAVENLEKRHGGPFPPRKRNGRRSIRSRSSGGKKIDLLA